MVTRSFAASTICILPSYRPLVISSHCGVGTRAPGNPARTLSDVHAHVSRFVNESSGGLIEDSVSLSGCLSHWPKRCIISARSGTRSDLGRWSSSVSQCSLAQTLAWLVFHLLAMVILTLALRCILIDSGSAAAAIDEPASERAYAFSHKRAMRHFGYAIGVPTHIARVGILRVDFSPRMKNPAISSRRSFLRDRNTCWASGSIRNFLNGIGIDSSS